MTRVLLVEQTSDPVGSIGRLATQLEALPARDAIKVEIVRPSGSDRAGDLDYLAGELEGCAAADTAVAIGTPSVTAPDAALLRLLDNPGLRLGVLVSADPTSHPVATLGSNILAAATAAHPIGDADAGSLGLIYLRSDVLSVVAAAIRAAAGDAEPSWNRLDLLDLLLAILVRSVSTREVPVTAVSAEPFPAARVTDAAEIERLLGQLAGVDECALAERSAARAGDGLYSTLVLRRISRRLTPAAVRRQISPNAITGVSTVLGLAGAAAFALGGYPALIVGALLLQASIVLDCVDGEVARLTRTGSPFGAWLDPATDRLKEYAALAGLAVGLGGGALPWALATTAMVVQTTRHVQDFCFDKGVLAQWRASYRDSRPLSDTSAWRRPRRAVAGTGDPRTLGGWLRRLAHMPISERWLALTVAALAGSALGALMAYLSLVVFAACWTLVGAVRRTVAARGSWISAPLRRTLAAYRDDGLLWPLTGALAPAAMPGWVLPVGVTAVEGAAAVAVTVAYVPEWLPAAFGWFAVVAWHRYDLVYRRGGSTPAVPVLVRLLGGGWAARIVVLLLGALGGQLPVVLVAGLAWLGVVYVPESLYNGLRTRWET